MQKAMVVRLEHASDVSNLNSYLDRGWRVVSACATQSACLVVLEAQTLAQEDPHKTLDQQ